jgi:hypothetical protein
MAGIEGEALDALEPAANYLEAPRHHGHYGCRDCPLPFNEILERFFFRALSGAMKVSRLSLSFR